MLGKELWLRVFANGAPRKIFACQETGENCVAKSLIICSVHQTLLGYEMRWVGHEAGVGEKRNA
jgi:hypothetical protein